MTIRLYRNDSEPKTVNKAITKLSPTSSVIFAIIR